jgi:hypothetical protein
VILYSKPKIFQQSFYINLKNKNNNKDNDNDKDKDKDKNNKAKCSVNKNGRNYLVTVKQKNQ